MLSLQLFSDIWHYLVLALTVGVAVTAAGHAVLYKRDTRGAVLWVALIWLAPLVGPALYFLLGINRIRRRAILLRGNLGHYRAQRAVAPTHPEALEQLLPPNLAHLRELVAVLDTVCVRSLLPGNRIDCLVNGDEAYPAMLEAIAGAKHSIALSTYIFDRDEVGLAFVQALAAAVRRGVEVRVLIDATGARYSMPSILGTLRREGVKYARFLPAFPSWRVISINLRNHRKILVVDGQVGFTGGMNIRRGHWLGRQPPHPVQDIQFRLEGPAVAHLQEVFADDWFFTTRESLRSEIWFPRLAPVGTAFARGIADGPDEDFDKLRWALLGALSAARRSIKIVTPYFLPEPPIISALNVAAMRGVAVDILLPSKNNLPFVQWASAAHWWQVLEHGCRIWLTPPPFDHSKLFLVDDHWALVGSTNWDPRSLRLNFEFNVECYDPALAQTLGNLFEERRRGSRAVTLEDVDARPLPVKLRDGIARLFTPFL